MNDKHKGPNQGAKAQDQKPADKPADTPPADTKPGSAADHAEKVILEKKLSHRVICGELTKPKEAGPLFNVLGSATGTKHGMSNYGKWVSFSGMFEARCLLPSSENFGKVFRGSQLFIPEPVQSELETLLAKSAEDNDGEIVPVMFAFEIGYKPSNRPGGVGYELTIAPLVKPSGADPLAGLRDQVLKLTGPDNKTA